MLILFEGAEFAASFDGSLEGHVFSGFGRWCVGETAGCIIFRCGGCLLVVDNVLLPGLDVEVVDELLEAVCEAVVFAFFGGVEGEGEHFVVSETEDRALEVETSNVLFLRAIGEGTDSAHFWVAFDHLAWEVVNACVTRLKLLSDPLVNLAYAVLEFVAPIFQLAEVCDIWGE